MITNREVRVAIPAMTTDLQRKVMPERFLIEKNDCDDLGFAKYCFISGVISFNEFKEWLYYVVEIQNDVPPYIWDLIDVPNKLAFNPVEIIGFNPYWKHSQEEDYALIGIGYKQNDDFENDYVDRANALNALSNNNHIESRFFETFPFLKRLA